MAENSAIEWTNRLFRLIDATLNLDWLILTKRPENIAAMMPHDWVGVEDRAGIGYTKYQNHPPRNLWLGVSVENQKAADERIPLLLQTPATVRFLSCEPLLGPLNLEPFMQYEPFHENYKMTFGLNDFRGIDWVIVGGESGHHARPCDLAWIRSIVEQCKDAGVACFVKQIGSNPTMGKSDYGVEIGSLKTIDKKGGDINEFPIDLRVREFPL